MAWIKVHQDDHLVIPSPHKAREALLDPNDKYGHEDYAWLCVTMDGVLDNYLMCGHDEYAMSAWEHMAYYWDEPVRRPSCLWPGSEYRLPWWEDFEERFPPEDIGSLLVWKNYELYIVPRAGLKPGDYEYWYYKTIPPYPGQDTTSKGDSDAV